MDFGFAPGTDGYLSLLRGMLHRRVTTTLIARRGVTALRRFITVLDTTTSIAKPIGDVLIGGHANHEGQFFLPAFPGQHGPTLFETLEQTLSDATKSIAIPDALIGYTTGDAITRSVHIKGCNIGKAQPFLLKLQEAMGSHVRVTAPKFFHGLTSAPQQGMFEYLAYEFALRRRDPFPDRRTALAIFDAEQFPLIDGSFVPTADWNSLVPPNPNVTRTQQFTAKLGVTLRNRSTIIVPRQYRVTPIRFVWEVFFPDAASVPTDDFTQRQALADSLQTDARFKANHPFPQWQREGFADFDEFLAGYRWTYRRRGATLVCTGRRLLYVHVVAVTDPTTTPSGGFFGAGNLLFNLYANSGSGLQSMTTALQETDPTFFATV